MQMQWNSARHLGKHLQTLNNGEILCAGTCLFKKKMSDKLKKYYFVIDNLWPLAYTNLRKRWK